MDLDALEVTRIAAKRLPPTGLRWGREGKPDSHWFYVSAGAKYRAWKDPTPGPGLSEKLIEMRVKGQTVAPGSFHEGAGERIRFEPGGDKEPTTIYPDVLVAASDWMAAVALVARYWREGGRHDMALALAGLFWHGGSGEDQAVAFMEDLYDAAGDPEASNRVDCVHDTYKNGADGKRVVGGPSLEQYLTKGQIQRLREWLGLNNSQGRDGHGHHQQPSEAKRLLALVKPIFDLPGNEIFRDAAGVAYATVPMRDHHRTFPVQSREMKLWLNFTFFEAEKANPAPEALSSLMNGMEARAMYDPAAQVHPVAVRMSQTTPDTLWLDLGDEEYHAVRITADSWQVVADPPVKFLRHKGLLPLPLPVQPAPGETLENLLRPFLNIPERAIILTDTGKAMEDPAWILLVTWLCAAYFPDGPFTNLLLKGAQGSGKSTAASILQRLLDPNEVERNGEPREMRDLAIAARNSWMLPFDNVRHVQPWLSDALSRMSTGGGMRTRALYTNDEEAIFRYKRPVLLTGISDVVTEPDLLRRTVVVTLAGIKTVKAERAFWAEFKAKEPVILGALLDVISWTLAELPGVEEDVESGQVTLAGMADYSVWALAVERAMRWEAGTFERAYRAVHREAREVALEASPIFSILESWLRRRRAMQARAVEDAQRQGKPTPEPLQPWRGNSAALLTELNEERRAQEAERNDSGRSDSGHRHLPAAPKGWPGSAKAMSVALAYIRQQLEEVGIQVDYKQHGRVYTITETRVAAADDTGEEEA